MYVKLKKKTIAFFKLNITKNNRDVIVNKKRTRQVKIRNELDG